MSELREKSELGVSNFFLQLWIYIMQFGVQVSELQDVKSQLWVIKSELCDIVETAYKKFICKI